MVDNSLPFFHQLRLLVSPSELGLPEGRHLADPVRPDREPVRDHPGAGEAEPGVIPFMRDQVRAASSCQVNVILPWRHLPINDPHFNASNGFPAHPVYVEGVDYLPGLAGESRDFDANGPYVRVLGTGGTTTYSLSAGLFGTALSPIEGSQPQTPPLHHSGDGAPAKVSRPPLKETVPCETQPPIPTLNDAAEGPSPSPVAANNSAPSTLLRRRAWVCSRWRSSSRRPSSRASVRITPKLPGAK